MGFRKVTLGLRSLRSREWGFAIPSGTYFFWFWSLKLAQVGTFFVFFRICSAFFGFPHSSWLFPSICSDFFRCFFDFSSIWDRFREGFSMIFDTFFETCQNVWKSTKHCVGAWILKVDSYKSKQILPQNCKKTMRIYGKITLQWNCWMRTLLTPNQPILCQLYDQNGGGTHGMKLNSACICTYTNLYCVGDQRFRRVRFLLHDVFLLIADFSSLLP